MSDFAQQLIDMEAKMEGMQATIDQFMMNEKYKMLQPDPKYGVSGLNPSTQMMQIDRAYRGMTGEDLPSTEKQAYIDQTMKWLDDDKTFSKLFEEFYSDTQSTDFSENLEDTILKAQGSIGQGISDVFKEIEKEDDARELSLKDVKEHRDRAIQNLEQWEKTGKLENWKDTFKKKIREGVKKYSKRYMDKAA